MSPKVAIVLIGLESLDVGGAERRISSLTHHLLKVDRDKQISLIINQELLKLLISIGLPPAGNVVVLKSWLTKSRELSQTDGFFFNRITGKFLSLFSHFFLFLQIGAALIWIRPNLVQLLSTSTLRIFFPYLYIFPSVKIVSLVGTETREYKTQKIYDRWLLKKYLRRVEVIDVISEELRDLLVSQELAPLNKIRINDSFIDSQNYTAVLDKKPWVVFAGRLIEGKNPLLFVEAIPDIIRRYNGSVHFFVLGSGPLERKIKERVFELELESYVTVQFVPNIGDILKHSLIFCSLQQQENYPSRSLLEAMVCANAIVATDVGYTHKLVNEDTGIRVPAIAENIADAVSNLLNSQTVALENGHNARDLVMNNYSPDSYARRVIKMYDEALAKYNQ